LRFEASPGKWFILSQKNPSEKKGAGGVAQVVEGLPSKREPLSSNPSTTKRKKENLLKLDMNGESP
jgi:hypothetical protein